jgi:hypothetical protein
MTTSHLPRKILAHVIDSTTIEPDRDPDRRTPRD